MGDFLDIKLLSYLFSIGPITVLMFLKFRRKSKTLNFFFIGYTLFSLNGIANVVIEITKYEPLPILIITLLTHYISISFFIMSVLYLIDIKSLKKVRFIYIGLVLFLFLSFCLYIINFELKGINNQFVNLVFSFIFLVNFCLLWLQPILLIINIKKFTGTNRKMVIEVIIFTFLFLVVVFMENFTSILFPQYHSTIFEIPGLFLLNISIVYLSIKYGFFAKGKKDLEATLQTLELTNREKDICRLLLENLPYKEIAGKLSISVDTVKTHVSNLYKKNGFKNRKELQIFFT